ncbi:TIGR02687 family protein [Dethiosulfatibacter aminovorans DSM 17477]|uniref:TIGR02687 family protein n=1 Tax=Dethiosulfatibacter aminovorans DSM 17477 TaxID=1121476 RepID=A0A1M6LD41_9FIRM|nr:BREX-1 system phosphatase PglZ type A [Dethiosulfatibacter aminovorans]SHJ69058.1 TIGR02687 family protein [Dethiosulfatibacter aminovorans DSM 17477]
MSELNLNQITDKLNSEFNSDVRKLVFWYDANAEFVADIDELELVNAKILKLEQDNQFQVKNLLERKDTESSYLIYAPFSKPALRDNHLADTIRYSKEFFADRASLLAIDLGVDEKYKEVLQKYIKFFAAKDRTQKFYDLEIENFNKQVIETAIMSVLCKTKVVSFEEIVRTIIIYNDLVNNGYLQDLEKYGLIDSFWEMCESTFGYTDVSPTLEKLIYTMFVTYTSKVIDSELPQYWKNYCSYKSGNIIAFLDGLMNSLIYHQDFDRLSHMVYQMLKGQDVFGSITAEEMVECELFEKIDVQVLKWAIGRLVEEDTDAKLNGHSIPEVCQLRRKMHFGKSYNAHYHILENAYHIVMAANYKPVQSVDGLIKQYTEKDYLIDQRYRYFYYHFDSVLNNVSFEELRDLVENIYTNRFLDSISVVWNKAFTDANATTGLVKQQKFYDRFIKGAKERIVVIVSDALRYEVGKSLHERLEEDEKCTATITPIQSVLPSYTRFGMSALLPHRKLTMSEDYKVQVDGKVCDDLKSREQILKSYEPNSRTVQFDDIKTMKIAELKEIFTGQEIVYIYHNQIDARGDKLNTENEVFTACEEAVEEIHTMIKRLTSANNIHFVITADHGFVYKRDKLVESDKISGFKKNAFVGRRYVVDDEAVQAEGIASVKLGDILENDDSRVISVPIGSDVFKVSGGGQNFVHGGSSLQEMIIPVIDVRTNKYHTETKTVSIGLVSLVNKITNLTTNLDFIQSDPVSDIFKETKYKVFFISDDNEKISNENIYVADKKDKDASKRIFRLKFTFKNKKYDRNRKYYLVAYDEKNSLEVIRHEIQMDLAFVDDFGF